jgi:hypothetical protein
VPGAFSGRTPPGSTPGLTPTASAAPTPLGGIGGTKVLGSQPASPAAEPSDAPAGPATTFGSAAGESMMRPATSRRWAIPAAAAVGLGVLALVLKLVVGGQGDKAPRTTGAAAAGPPGPAATPAAPASPLAPVAAAPESVTLDLRGLPVGAELRLDGAVVSGPPLKLRRDGKRHLLEVSAAGYNDRTLELEADRDRVVDLPLTPVSKAEKQQTAEATPRDGHPASRAPSGSRSPSRRNGPGSDRKASENNAEKSTYDDM